MDKREISTADVTRKQRLKEDIREWVDAFIIAFILAMIIRSFIIQPFKIPTGSMRMTLVEGDHLFVNKLRYGPLIPFTKIRLPGFSQAQRGDIIVFIYPEDPKRDFIKRLIAFGGETVEIKDGRIYINGEVLDSPRVRNIYYYNRGEYGREDHPTIVPEGYYYVLGDNSASSQDSRYWGFVPKENVIGRAEFIFWPLHRIRFLK